MSVRVRFAPAPSGPLHLGQARTALFNWLFARKRAGQFLLRLEDTDRERVLPGAEPAILADLAWLGLECDEPLVRQSERIDRYRAAVEQLIRLGAAYPCFCSPEELERRWAAAGAGHPLRYDGRCRALAPGEAGRRRARGEPATVRFTMPGHAISVHDVVKGTVHFVGADLGDFVILRGDDSAAGILAAVVDDAAMRITHVIRGDDHLANAPRQIALGQALGYPVPVFAHLPLLVGPDGAPLSKRHGAVSVAEYREAGILAEGLLNYLGLLGWSPPAGQDEVMSKDALVRLWALDRVSRSPARFGPDRLLWFNRQHLRRLAPERLAEALGADRAAPTLRALEIVRREARTLSEARAALHRIAHGVGCVLDAEDPPRLRALRAALRGSLATEADAQALLEGALQASGAGRRAFMQTVRRALTGEAHGLPVAALLWILGGEEIGRRLDALIRVEDA